MSKYGSVEEVRAAPAGQSRTLAAVLALCLTLAVAAVLVVSFQTARPVVLDSFDPVSRGVYGPWKPVIKRDPSDAFNRHHILSGEMKDRPLELARERRSHPRFIKV